MKYVLLVLQFTDVAIYFHAFSYSVLSDSLFVYYSCNSTYYCNVFIFKHMWHESVYSAHNMDDNGKFNEILLLSL